MSISSLVSFARKEIFETIPGLQIATYRLKEAEAGKPVILHIGDSHYYKPDVDGRQDLIYVPSAQIAESLVHMHNTSQLCYKTDAHPAFFCVPDIPVDPLTLVKDYKDKISQALAAQRLWFVALVRMADDDWQVAQRHNMISGLQRIAARELKLQRPWLLDIEEETGLPACSFCGKNLLAPNAPICPNCNRVLNPARLAEIEKGLLGKVTTAGKLAGEEKKLEEVKNA
jgi:hypothetical protein